MFVTIRISSRFTKLLVGTVLLMSLLGGASWFCWWFTTPHPPPRIGIDAASDAIVQQLFQSGQLGAIRLGPTEELLAELADDQLDYVVELDQPTPDFITWPIGQLVPAIIVPYFDSASGMSTQELGTILEADPAQVLVSNTLALPSFPWSDHPVQYLPSADVIAQLTNGQGRIGLVPLQDRVPSVRVLPLAGVDPRRQREQPCDPYPLSRSLYLGRPPSDWLRQMKERYIRYRGGTADEIRLAPGHTPYANPWAEQIQMIAVGDVMLDREVKKVGLDKGWEFIFEEVAPYIRQADIAFANLESPIGDKGHFINMFQAPPEAIRGLVHAGFDVVSLANNHTLDYHHAGMFETMRLLQEHGIDWVGAGSDIDEARQPLIRNVDGVGIGFLSYTEMWFVHAREPISWQATEDEPGVAPARIEDIVADVRTLRDTVDVVVVTVHWGKEYTSEPTQEQQQLARAAVDAGADVVLGHHPHVLQGIEFYKDGVIAYSLGNFVFDLNIPNTWETMMLEFSLSTAGILDMTIIPTYISGVQPRILAGYRRDALYNHIRSLSLSE